MNNITKNTDKAEGIVPEVHTERFRTKYVDRGAGYDEKIMFDEKEISRYDLVKIANQLASALADRGCHFEVEK